jgi:7-carboxy-7-deazaguanine synthase
MPGLSILKISEIFWSFQGEGLRVGYPSIFLRLAGCALQCPYCDSKDSWKTGPGTCLSMSAREILPEIDGYARRYPQSQVVITGGEPLEQDLSQITAELKKKNYFLSIETNGLHCRELPIDWWTVSPKDVTGYFIHENLLKKTTEIKLIVNKNLTVSVIKRIREKVEKVPIFLQPDGYDKNRYANTFLLFRRCREEGIENIRAGIQLHKIYEVK